MIFSFHLLQHIRLEVFLPQIGKKVLLLFICTTTSGKHLMIKNKIERKKETELLAVMKSSHAHIESRFKIVF